MSDAADLAAARSNKKIQNNLRDGLPYPYTEQDGTEYIYQDFYSKYENEVSLHQMIWITKKPNGIYIEFGEHVYKKTEKDISACTGAENVVFRSLVSSPV